MAKKGKHSKTEIAAKLAQAGDLAAQGGHLVRPGDGPPDPLSERGRGGGASQLT